MEDEEKKKNKEKEAGFLANMMQGAMGTAGPAGAVGAIGLGILKEAAAKKQRRAAALSGGTEKVGNLQRDLGRDEASILQNLMSNLRQTMLF